jgi:hypothetical protein
MALITVYVANGLLSLVKGCRCAHDVWHGLERVFRAQLIGRKYAVHEQLRSVKKRSNEPVLMFVARAENLREELVGTCDERTPGHLFFSYILGGLGPRFADIWKQIRFSGLESMNLETLKDRLMLAEAEIIEAPPARAPVVNKMQKQRRCYGCGQIGHIKINCPTFKGKRIKGRNNADKFQRKATLPCECFSIRHDVIAKNNPVDCADDIGEVLDILCASLPIGYPGDSSTGAWTPAWPPTPYPAPDYSWSPEEEIAGPCCSDNLLSDLHRPDEPYVHEDLDISLESGEIPPCLEYVSKSPEDISPLVEGDCPLSFIDWEIMPSLTRRSDDPALAEIHSRSSVEPGAGEVEELPDKKRGLGLGMSGLRS